MRWLNPGVCRFGLQQLQPKHGRRHHVAQAQTRREHFGERSEVHDTLRPMCRQWRGRRFVVPQFAIRVVLDDGQADGLRGLDDGFAAIFTDLSSD